LRTYFLLGCLAGWLACALPCAAAGPLDGLLACRALTDSAARLACFDRETAALATAPAPPLAAVSPNAAVSPAAAAAAAVAPATAATQATVAPQSGSTTAIAAPPVRAAPVLDAQQSFGLSGSAIAAHEEAAGTRPQKLAKLDARVVALALAGNGRTVFTLDNTQVWQQLESSGDMLAKLGDSATISRGLLGSYWLQLKNGRGCKVTRVR
jgi:hypothetical protein